MKKLLLLFVLLFAGCGAAAGPPADFSGHWQGWAEPSMDIKHGYNWHLEQTGEKVTGTYKMAVQNALGGSEESGKVEGTVRGDELTLTFSREDGHVTDDLPTTVKIKVSGEAGQRMLKGYFDDNGDGIGVKYELKEKKK